MIWCNRALACVFTQRVRNVVGLASASSVCIISISAFAVAVCSISKKNVTVLGTVMHLVVSHSLLTATCEEDRYVAQLSSRRVQRAQTAESQVKVSHIRECLDVEEYISAFYSVHKMLLLMVHTTVPQYRTLTDPNRFCINSKIQFV